MTLGLQRGDIIVFEKDVSIIIHNCYKITFDTKNKKLYLFKDSERKYSPKYL